MPSVYTVDQIHPISSFLHTLDSLIQNNTAIICGDFNINLTDIKDNNINMLRSFMSHRNFTMVLNLFATTIYNSLLDHIWVRDNTFESTNIPIYSYFSDHIPVMVALRPKTVIA